MFPSTTLTVQSRIRAFVALATVGALALGGLAYQQSREAAHLSDQLMADVVLVRATGQADMVHDGLMGTTRAARLAGPASGQDEQAALRRELADYRRTMSEAMAQVLVGVAGNAADDPVRLSTENLQPVVERYTRSAEALVHAALSAPAELEALLPTFEGHFKQLEERLGRLSALIEARAQRSVRARDRTFERQRWLTLAVLGAIVTALVLTGRRFNLGLEASLGAEPQRLSAYAQAIADGVLYVDFDGPPPTPGSVAGAMQTMRDKLREAVQVIRESAENVAAGSTEIASGNQDLANRTVTQVCSLQRASASMSQMTGSVQQSAEHAQLARALAARASDVARRGGDAVQRVVQTMGDIQNTSHRIAAISQLINDFAAQTKILALNAAVEAARAGPSGQGFTVVAVEVGRLAQRSAAAAHEIRDLVETSAGKVAAGGQLAADAGATMTDIVAQVEHVQVLIDQIGQAASEQTAGIGTVTGSVTSLDQSTQQNVALVEQSAAAARMLRDQAHRLAGTVAGFRLEMT